MYPDPEKRGGNSSVCVWMRGRVRGKKVTECNKWRGCNCSGLGK